VQVGSLYPEVFFRNQVVGSVFASRESLLMTQDGGWGSARRAIPGLPLSSFIMLVR